MCIKIHTNDHTEKVRTFIFLILYLFFCSNQVMKGRRYCREGHQTEGTEKQNPMQSTDSEGQKVGILPLILPLNPQHPTLTSLVVLY